MTEEQKKFSDRMKKKVREQEFQFILDRILPKCSPEEQNEFFRQVAEESDRELRDLARRDPIARIPMS